MKAPGVIIVLLCCSGRCLASANSVDDTKGDSSITAPEGTADSAGNGGAVLSRTDTVVTIAGPWVSGETTLDTKSIQVVRLEDLGAQSGSGVSFPDSTTLSASEKVTWRQAVAAADKHDESMEFAPADLDETVLNTIIANRHGKNPGIGPVSTIADSYAVTASNGTDFADVSRSHFQDLFTGVAGGFDSAAVLRRANLRLVSNQALERFTEVMPAGSYPAYFRNRIGSHLRSPAAGPGAEQRAGRVVLHEAILYPPAFDTVRAVSWQISDKPLTVDARLADPAARPAWVRALAFAATKLPQAGRIRRYLADPLFYWGGAVVRENYALSGGATDLLDLPQSDPAKYVTQEYYVPVAKFDAFRERFAGIVAKYQVPVVSVSVQFAPRDEESFLSWARTDVFAFAITYETQADPAAWSREMIAAAIDLGGAFDLASQMRLATADQICRAYPRMEDFLSYKFEVDDSYRFHNALCDVLCPGDDFETNFRWERNEEVRQDFLWEKYGAIRTFALKTDAYSLAAIVEQGDIPQRIEFMQAMSAANAACLKQDLNLTDEHFFLDALKSQGLPDYLVRAFAHADLLRTSNAEYSVGNRRIDEDSIKTVISMLTLAADQWGRWLVDRRSGSVLFVDANAARQYRQLVETRDALAREEKRRDRKEIEDHPGEPVRD